MITMNFRDKGDRFRLFLAEYRLNTLFLLNNISATFLTLNRYGKGVRFTPFIGKFNPNPLLCGNKKGGPFLTRGGIYGNMYDFP